MFLNLLQKIFQPVIKIVQPIVKAVQTVVNLVQTAAQNPNGQQMTGQQPSATPTVPAQPATVSASPDPVLLRQQQKELARQRAVDEKAREFDKDIARTSSDLGEWDRSPVSLRELNEEIDNPMYRAIKRRMKYQPEIFDAILKASPSPEKAFNTMFVEWGRDGELDARALAMWARYHQSSVAQVTSASQPNMPATPLETADAQQQHLPQWLQDVAGIVRTPGALGAIGQGIILNTVYGVDLTHSNGGNWIEWFRQDEHAAERIQEAFSAVTDITAAIAGEAYRASGGPEIIRSQIAEWIKDPLNSQVFRFRTTRTPG